MENVEDAYPLNAAHRGMLFHSLQCEEVDVYLSVISVRIQGKLNRTLLQRAWQLVFSHHTSLRSGVVFDGLDDPLWVVHKSIEPEWEFLDFSSLSTAECSKAEREAHSRLEQTQFKFATEALMKFTLITLDDNSHRLLWGIHHLISDGWSTSVILEDLSTAYTACVRGVKPALPLALSYGRFLESQSQLDAKPLKTYWSEYLHGRYPTPIKFGESLRDADQAKRYASETRLEFDESRSRAITEAARRFETTINVLFVSAWGVVLRDLCQNESPLFGITLAGRSIDLPGIERGVGLYAATLPLCIDTDGEQSLKNWLHGIGKTLLTHAEHDALSVVDIQKLVKRESNEPLFSSVVALAGHDSGLCFSSVENNDIQIDSLEYQIRSHFDVSLLIKPGKRTSLHLISQSEKMNKASNDAILKRFTNILDFLIDDTCATLPILRDRCNQLEQEYVVSGAGASPATHQYIDAWVTHVANQNPSACALVQGNERLSYNELEHRLQQISQAIALRVSTHDGPIAISLTSGIDAVVAMLGVLRSGRCYLPLDPQQPIERQALLCKDADCALVIVDHNRFALQSKNEQSSWPVNSGLRAIITSISALQTQGDVAPSDIVKQKDRKFDSPAYLMYTSGSTGKPKGVVISHSNLVYSTQARFDYYPEPVKKFLLVSPLHFDSSVVGLYWTLCSGGTIVFPEAENRKELTHWSNLVSKHQISHVLCLPSVYRMWVGNGDATQLTTLDTVIVAGEACDADLCSTHYQKLPGTRLYNEYGPTEACVWSSVHYCDAHESVSVPIGYPIPGTRIKVVGFDGATCPTGVEGELHLISQGVAKGYYKQPELTEKYFSSNPSSYKTGDLGYRSQSGALYCTGRIDRQLKIRGQRIEPAEIELVARRVPGVGDVRAFVASRHADGPTRLCLAYTPNTIAHDQIDNAVKAHLPASMWPHTYLSLEMLPTLSNGKICEQQLTQLLPEPNKFEEATAARVPSETETELTLLRKVNKLLGADKATVSNNAVQCGLDSIDSMKLTAQLREEFEIDLRLACVLESQHWGELAARICMLVETNNASEIRLAPGSKATQTNQSMQDTKPNRVNKTEVVENKPQFPLSAQQLPLWFLDQTGLQPQVYAMQSTWRCVGKLCVPAVEYALNALAQQHEVLRTRFRVDNNGDPYQVVFPTEPVQFEVIDKKHSQLVWETVRDRQMSQRFDLANDQLLRALVYQYDKHECYLLFHTHHIAMDGWSFDVLHSLFVEHYTHCFEALHGKSEDIVPSKVPELPLPAEYQYRDFTLWQQKKDAHIRQSDIKHWCQVLAAPRERLQLPLDFDRPTRPSFKGASVVKNIEQETIEHWAQLARNTLSTPYVVALAAVKTGLRCIFEAEDLLIGTPVSNRIEPKWQNMLGFFTNTVVIRTGNTKSDSFTDNILQTRSATLQALQHESAPFDQVVRALGLQGSADQNPLFDVFFLYKHQHDILPSMPGVETELVNQVELENAKFDLAIEIRPSSDIHEPGYELHLNYNVDLFLELTIDRLASELLSVMSATASQPRVPVADTASLLKSVVTVAPKSLHNNCNIDNKALLVNHRLDQAFLTQVEKNPNAIALTHNAVSVSYATLNQLVERISQSLRESGILQGEVIAVSLPRSIHQIATALAVSRCEAVWCPVDPDYPQTRKQYMYSDSGARFLIAAPTAFVDKSVDTTMLHIIIDPDAVPSTVIPLPAALEEKKLQLIDKAASRYRHDNGVGVLMYTSGSEGNPKGVLLSHHAMMNRFVWMWNRYPYSDDDVNVIKTSCSFVDSLWECFGALLMGTPSVIIDDAAVTDIDRFLTELRDNKVTRLLVVPSLLNSMLDWLAMYDQQLPDLRLCSCSGEVLPVQLANRLLQALPHIRLLNLYGSTEVAADVTCQEIVVTADAQTIPLGSTIDGISAYILDEEHNVLAPGKLGEIAFTGLGLAIGYHADANLSAHKFIDISDIGRVFLTGDVGHIDAFGRLYFDGRKDRQLKVRGVRVNCHEIEQQINLLPDIANNVVFALGELEERQLCAVVQCSYDSDKSNAVDSSLLLNQLQQQLPTHQLPDRILVVESLPQLPNGKPDRLAAAQLFQEPGNVGHSTVSALSSSNSKSNKIVSTDNSSLSSDYHEYQLMLQEPMLALWRDILNNNDIDLNDDFFESGGYSLLAVKLVMRVNSEVLSTYNLQMTIGDLLEERSVSKIAQQQAQKIASSTLNELETRLDSLMTLQSGTGNAHLFMVPPFGHTGFFFRKFAEYMPKDLSVYSFDMAISVEHKSLGSLCSKLVDELLDVQPNGPWVIVAGCLGNVLAFEMAHQLKTLTGKECELYLLDSGAPRNGPGWNYIKKERRSGMSHYWSIFYKEFKEDYCRNLIGLKMTRYKAKFDVGIKKYLDVRVAQSKLFNEYQGRTGSADITFFRSGTFMKKPHLVERWSKLTAGNFKLYDFPKIAHRKLLTADSRHWAKIAPIVLQSSTLQSGSIVKQSSGDLPYENVADKAVTTEQAKAKATSNST